MNGESKLPSSSSEVQALLVCPLSWAVMEDPVVLLPGGMTYDREHICASLLHHPNLDPFSGVRYDCKLQYCDNVSVRQLLMAAHGTKAYNKYDDSGFQTRYQEAWRTLTARKNNVEVYERLAPMMWGMLLLALNLYTFTRGGEEA
jgi:hypothetical protein